MKPTYRQEEKISGCGAMTMKKKFMPEDMERIRYLSYPAVTADGSLIAWVETTGNSEDGSFRPNILVWDSRTKEIRRWSISPG